MIRTLLGASVAALALTSCSLLPSGGSASEGAPKPLDFCSAMIAASEAAGPAVESLNGMFTTMDTLASSTSSATDLEQLQAAGAVINKDVPAYVSALGVAEGLAPADIQDDLQTLQDYWTLYVIGLAQTADAASGYGDFVDQSSALQSAEKVAALIEAQGPSQDAVNTVYLAQCSSS